MVRRVKLSRFSSKSGLDYLKERSEESAIQSAIDFLQEKGYAVLDEVEYEKLVRGESRRREILSQMTYAERRLRELVGDDACDVCGKFGVVCTECGCCPSCCADAGLCF